MDLKQLIYGPGPVDVPVEYEVNGIKCASYRIRPKGEPQAPERSPKGTMWYIYRQAREEICFMADDVSVPVTIAYAITERMLGQTIPREPIQCNPILTEAQQDELYAEMMYQYGYGEK